MMVIAKFMEKCWKNTGDLFVNLLGKCKNAKILDLFAKFVLLWKCENLDFFIKFGFIWKIDGEM